MQEQHRSPNKRGIIAWCFFDWANSAFPTVITTFVFSAYFTQYIAKNPIQGTAQWGYAIALAGLITAIGAPLFGAIADHQGRRKPWLAFFTVLCIGCCTLLWWAKPQHDYILFTLAMVAIATICFEMGTAFYNAMLRTIVPLKYLGRVSGWAWGIGYFGGLCCLLVALFVFVQGHVPWLHLDRASQEQIRICGPLVAVWFGLFSIPLFLWTPDRPKEKCTAFEATRQGLKTLRATLKELPKNKNILLFLIAHMIYIDGLNTIFAFGGIYAAGTFGMSIEQVMLFGIVANISAGLGAAAFAWLDDYLGSKHTILLALLLLLGAVTGLVFVKQVRWFWALGILLSVFVGPVQAASRSMMAKIAPENKSSEMFGLYALTGKITAFMGPWVLGVVTTVFVSQRAGIATVIFFLVVGGLLLTRCHE